MIFTEEQLRTIPDSEIDSLFDIMIRDTMTDEQFEEWVKGWFNWQEHALEVSNDWETDVKREDLLDNIDILNQYGDKYVEGRKRV